MPISYLYVDTKWKPYECNTCSNDESRIFNEVVCIIINFNLMKTYINKNMVPTFKKDKIDESFKTIYFFFFWKIPCIEKLFILENYLDGKML